jgi:hypothetical protein
MAIAPYKHGELTRDTPGNTGLVFIVSSLFTCRELDARVMFARPINIPEFSLISTG